MIVDEWMRSSIRHDPLLIRHLDMVVPAIKLVVIQWVVVRHALVALSQEDVSSNRASSVQAAFRESYYLQNVGDLQSAARGYQELARGRRGGPPWPKDFAVAKDSGSFATGERDSRGQMITTGRGGGGDSSDAGGVIGSDGGGYGRGGNNGDENHAVPDALEAFLEPYDAIVREFNSRAASNWARAASEGLKVSSGWGADVFDPSARGSNFVTAPHKLDHDREQLEYLVAKGRLPQEFQRLAEEYGTVGDLVKASLSEARKGQLERLGQGLRALTYGLGTSDFGRLRGTYNSVIHVPKGPADEDVGGGYHPTGFRRALNPNLDWRAIEDEYLSQELPLLWFDGFLLPEALQGVLDFCREATVFFDIKPGYLGAYFNDGLTSPWLVQIAHELQERLPQVLEGMTLSNLWAYKFDSDTSMDGIATHSDHATVNLNFWVTPDDANLDPSSGGLVVYPKVPPSGDDPNHSSSGGTLDMKQWNNSSRVSDIESWLKDEGVYDLAVTVPYRQNRVVVFDSRLLHRSDKFLFREGYENRRINLTFLFSPVDEAWNEDYHRQSRQQQE